MQWNRYSCVTVGVGGALRCNGAVLLQCMLPALVAVMSAVMFGQQTQFSALAVMVVTPWWAEWRGFEDFLV